MKYNINYNLKDIQKIPKKNINVFSTFACGGGSTLGYKLNGLHELVMEFDETPIPFGQIRSAKGKEPTEHAKAVLRYYRKGDKCLADINKRIKGKNTQFTQYILQDDQITNTVTSTGVDYRAFDKMECSDEDYTRRQSFPLDYNYMGLSAKYVTGMSVPPIMMAQIVAKVVDQWKLNK